MRSTSLFVAGCLFSLVACGTSEDRFLTDGLPAWCEAAANCEGFEVDACIDHIRAVERSECDYDPGAARSCVNAIEVGESTCVDNRDLGTMVFDGPAMCDDIWPDCGPLFSREFPVGTSPDSTPTP